MTGLAVYKIEVLRGGRWRRLYDKDKRRLFGYERAKAHVDRLTREHPRTRFRCVKLNRPTQTSPIVQHKF